MNPLQSNPTISECNREVEARSTEWMQSNIIKLSEELGVLFNGFHKEAKALFLKLDQRRGSKKTSYTS